MSALKIGAISTYPPLAGKWSIWSQAAEAPGAYFIVPVDEEARAVGVKYAVIRAIQKRTEPKPSIELIRTDPHKPGLVDAKAAKR